MLRPHVYSTFISDHLSSVWGSLVQWTHSGAPQTPIPLVSITRLKALSTSTHKLQHHFLSAKCLLTVLRPLKHYFVNQQVSQRTRYISNVDKVLTFVWFLSFNKLCLPLGNLSKCPWLIMTSQGLQFYGFLQALVHTKHCSLFPTISYHHHCHHVQQVLHPVTPLLAFLAMVLVTGHAGYKLIHGLTSQMCHLPQVHFRHISTCRPARPLPSSICTPSTGILSTNTKGYTNGQFYWLLGVQTHCVMVMTVTYISDIFNEHS